MKVRVKSRACPGWNILKSACLAMVIAVSGQAAVALSAEPQAGKPAQTPEQLAEQARVQAKAFRDDLVKRAKGGEPDVILDLATLLEQGDASAPADRAAAMDLFEKAADLRNPFARQRMCIAYLLGEGRPKDVAKASTYCDLLGVKDPVGLFWAGYAFEQGIGGPADETSAMAIYAQAVDLGSGDAADALGKIALAKKAPAAARKWFRRGTMLGSADAMDHLAAMTEAGEGGETDLSEAGWLYGEAASRGNDHAGVWVRDHPGLPVAPSIALGTEAGKAVRFIHSYTKGGHPGQEVMDFARIVKLLTDNYPGTNPFESPGQGHATIDCYVDSHRDIDTCVVREYPIAYGFGPTLEAFFSGRVAVDGQDSGGHPVSRTRVIMSVQWMLGG